MTEEKKALEPCLYCGRTFEGCSTRNKELHENACPDNPANKVSKSEPTELEKDIETAKARQLQRRKKAPEGITAIPSGMEDPLTELKHHAARVNLVKWHWEDVVVQGQAQHNMIFDDHVVFLEGEKHKMHIENGYEPVVENGKHLGHSEMKMYKIPNDIHRERISASEKLSADRLNEFRNKTESTITGKFKQTADSLAS